MSGWIDQNMISVSVTIKRQMDDIGVGKTVSYKCDRRVCWLTISGVNEWLPYAAALQIMCQETSHTVHVCHGFSSEELWFYFSTHSRFILPWDMLDQRSVLLNASKLDKVQCRQSRSTKFSGLKQLIGSWISILNFIMKKVMQTIGESCENNVFNVAETLHFLPAEN